MDDFYAARSSSMPPLPWPSFSPPFSLITIRTDAFAWVPGDADWDVGVPEVSNRETVRDAREAQDRIRQKQRVGV